MQASKYFCILYSLKWRGFSTASWSCTTPLTCWWPASPICVTCLFPTSTGSEGRHSVLNQLLPLVGFWVGGNRPVSPNRFVWHDLGLLGVSHAYMWEWGPCCTGPWPRHVAHYDDTWQVSPSCSWVHAKLITRHRGRHNGGQVWRFDAILEEYGIPTFICNELHPVHNGQHYWDPNPHIISSAEAEATCQGD